MNAAPSKPVGQSDAMKLFRRFRYLLLFLGVLLFCSVMIVRQFQHNVSKHVERREAFILLFVKGYRTEAFRLYERLLAEVPAMSNEQLLDDFQRTLQVVNAVDKSDNGNLNYNYHWEVSKQMEIRAADILERAKKLAAQ
jgi:hypothetical protein